MSADSLAEWAGRLAEEADRSVNVTRRTLEADLRADLFTVLFPYARDEVGIPQADIRQEGTGLSGRFDSLFGRCVIEYKKPGLLVSHAEREAAAEQGIRYLEDPIIGADVVIITDGATWGVLRDLSAGPETGEQGWLDLGGARLATPHERFAWRPNSPETAERVLTLMATVVTAPVGSESLKARLGAGNPDAMNCVSRLGKALHARAKDGRTDTLFRQWLQMAGVAYGIASATSPWPKPPPTLLGNQLAGGLGECTYPEAIFALHTYIAFASKVVAAEVLSLVMNDQESRPTQWTSLPSAELARQMFRLENGALTARIGAPDLLAGDLFNWYVHELERTRGLETAVRTILSHLGSLAWARLANASGVAGDLLRELYASIVPSALRKALGEFFTPYWLAQRVFQKALDFTELHDGPTRILDPSCGSGTFLVIALRWALADARSRTDPSTYADAAVEVLDTIVGLDINPVAIVMAKVNLLLALGDLIGQLPRVSFHIYQADSILLPDVMIGQATFDQSEAHRVLPLVIGDVDIPEPLASLKQLEVLRQNVERGIQEHREPATFRARLKSELARDDLSPANIEDSLVAASRLYERILELDSEGRNGVWARIVEQYFAPVTLPKADIVVGNPPWVSWKHLPPYWKQRSERLWQRWGLWATRQRGGGVPLSDISMLLLARSITDYCKDSGVVALLLPKIVLIGTAGADRFRRCRFSGTWSDSDTAFPEPDAEVEETYQPLYIDDFSELHPFAPDAANKPIALYVRPGSRPVWPITQSLWSRQTRQRRRGGVDSWGDVAARLSERVDPIGPLEPDNVMSPWVVQRRDSSAGVELRSQIAARAYSWGEGGNTRGGDGLFYVRVVTPRPVNGLVRIESVREAGRKFRDVPSASGEVEAAFLWPLLRGRDVRPFRIDPSDLYVILPHDPDDLSRPLTSAELIREAPYLYDFLSPLTPYLMQRSPYHGVTFTAECPWPIQGPWSHLNRGSHLVVCQYMSPDGRPPAAAVSPQWDVRTGLNTVPYPNNKSNVLVVDSADEAHYVAAWVNSSPCQDALARFVSSTAIPPTALNRLPLPQFDKANDDHIALARLSLRLSENEIDDDERQVVQAEIDGYVTALLG